MARILPVLLFGHTCFFRTFPLGNCCYAPQGCGTFAAHRAGVWSVRRTVSAFPAVYAVRQVFRLGQVLLPRLVTFPCVPTVAAACTAACKPGPAVTAAVPHRSFTCFPILPAGLAAPDTLQLLCAYQNITNIFIMQTKMPRNHISFAAFLMFGFSGIRSRPPHRCGYAGYGTAMRADHTAPGDAPQEARGSN